MSYLGKEKSNFMQIFMALSIVAVVSFGLMYFMFGKSVAENGDAANQTAKDLAPPQAVQTMSKTVHTHV